MNAPTAKPNVLFVVLDQLRADCLNGELAETVDLPHLRAFMKDAVSFTNHVTVTCPCGPARASLLTGQYAMNHRAVRNGRRCQSTSRIWRLSFVAAGSSRSFTAIRTPPPTRVITRLMTRS